jgi:hypothetical protein
MDPLRNPLRECGSPFESLCEDFEFFAEDLLDTDEETEESAEESDNE